MYIYIYIYIYETLRNLNPIMPHKQGCALVCAYTLHKENEIQKRADAFTSSRAQLPW